LGLARPETAFVAERRFPPMTYYVQVTLTVVAVLVVLSAARLVLNILTLVVVAAVLAVGLEPAVRRLERWRISRGWAVLLIFGATIAFLILFALLVIPPLVREVSQLARNIPDYVRRLKTENGFFGDLERKYDISTKLKGLVSNLPSAASRSLGAILGLTKSIASVVFNLLTVTILTIYFMLALPRMHEGVVALFPEEQRDRNSKVMDEALEKIGGYVSGNITVSIIAGVAAYIALRIIGVPFPEALAMWVAIADLIPTVGATLGALAAVIVAAFASVPTAIVTGVYFLIYQQVENYFISPRVMQKAVDLSPAAVIVSVLIGGSLAGFAGALLALPLAAAAKVVVRDIWLGPRLALARKPTPKRDQRRAKAQA
jgi:predicted PurR-regulated permease PerM